MRFPRRLEKTSPHSITKQQYGSYAFSNSRLAPLHDPRSIGAALRGPVLGRFWKYRVGDHRVIAEIEDRILMILVVKVGNRKDVYRR